MNKRSTPTLSPALTVIVMFGLISLLGDLVYESARGANSQYFSLLGVSAAQVGLVFGIGEFLGYVLRLLAGIFSDKSGRHWVFLFVGYGMLLVVPFLGLTQSWPVIVILVLMERIGKALRNPSKDTILSAVAAHPDTKIGIGTAFGLQEALDQIGAFTGPLIFTVVFAVAKASGVGEYQLAYRFLGIPFILLMLFLIFSQRKVSRYHLIPDPSAHDYHSQHLQKIFWIYTVFTFFATLGLVNFSVVGYHLKAQNLMSDGQITLMYSLAMVVDAITALLAGRIYDRLKAKSGVHTRGLLILLIIPIASVLLPFLTLSHSLASIIAGMMVFGVVLGLHETVMRSSIADLTPFRKRGTSYGVFNASYGLSLLFGAAAMGWFYDRGLQSGIISLTVAAELVALVLFYQLFRTSRQALDHQNRG